ncbi:MAG: phage terminase large subunit family protein [bacterium]|nr:phage terminase large subunit family protein [bacterium]
MRSSTRTVSWARREHYPAVVPLPVLVLTAGVDVQDDRLEVEVCGWRTGEESWGISYRCSGGDPAAAPGLAAAR